MELSRFHAVKAPEVARLKALAREGRLPAPLPGPRPSFLDALAAQGGLPAVVAEYKRASPSRGLICDTVTPEEALVQYALNGAAACSVLTETEYFRGDLSFLERGRAAQRAAGRELPLLRKDFLLDEVQVLATAATPAAALLLMVRLTPDAGLLGRLRELAESFGIQAVVEIFDERELAIARDAGARIVQVNARDLETFRVDRTACIRFIETHPPLPHERWIQASGVEEGSHLVEAAQAGYDAVLVGTTLMRDATPGATLRGLVADAAALAGRQPVTAG